MRAIDGHAKNEALVRTAGQIRQPYQSLPFVLAFALVLASCKTGGVNSSATPVSTPKAADAIVDCRSLAPEDPYVDEPAKADRAYAACRQAVELAPSDPEMLYRLGTSAFQKDLMDEAAANFHKAEQLGYCKALYFLGEDAWYGLKDEKSAEDYYKRGTACGDERAAHEIFSPSTFEKSAHPDLIEALYNSDTGKLNKVRFATASYVAGFYEALSEQFLGKEFDPCWTANYYRGGDTQNALLAAEKGDASNRAESLLYENALPFVFSFILPAQGSQALEDFRASERKAGHADLIRLVQSSKCNALLPHKIVNGIEEFARTKRTLIDVVREAKPNIHSMSDLAELVRQGQ